MWLCAAPGRALGQPAPLRVVVRVVEPDDRLLLERVRGQTNDLDVAIETDSGHPLEPNVARQLRRARELTEERGARVAVWFARDARGLTVYVVEPAAGRVLARRLGSGAEGEAQQARQGLAASADYEAAALLVRSALRVLASGEQIGVAEAEVAREEPAAPPTPPPAPSPPAPPVRPSVAAPSPWSLALALGWLAAADGVAGRGQHAVHATLALRRARFAAGLRLGVGAPVPLRDALASVRLARQELSLLVGGALWRARAVRVGAMLGAGVLRYAQRVRSRALDFRAQARADRWLSALHGQLSVEVRPRAFGGRLGASLSAGADLLPAPLELGYLEQGRFVRWRRLALVQPRGGLALWLRLR